MDLKLLRRFVAVAQTLSFRQGALRLGMTQPPLSRSIRQLESDIGTRLLERGARGVSLTVAGRVLLDESPRLLEHADLVQRVTQQSLEARRLNVGFLTMALYGALPVALKLFRSRWPGADLRLQELSTGEQYQRLQNGTLDVGFVGLDARPHDDLAVRIIERSRLVLAVPADWELARRKNIALAELAGVPLIVSARSANPYNRDQIELKCRAAGLVPNIVHEAGQVYPILKLVACGAGVGFIPEISRVHNVAGVRYLPVRDESFNIEMLLGMIWVDRKLPATLGNFIKCVTESVGGREKKARP